MEKGNIGVATKSALSVAHCASEKKRKEKKKKNIYIYIYIYIYKEINRSFQ